MAKIANRSKWIIEELERTVSGKAREKAMSLAKKLTGFIINKDGTLDHIIFKGKNGKTHD